jgi:hypothetical protein
MQQIFSKVKGRNEITPSPHPSRELCLFYPSLTGIPDTFSPKWLKIPAIIVSTDSPRLLLAPTLQNPTKKCTFRQSIRLLIAENPPIASRCETGYFGVDAE